MRKPWVWVLGLAVTGFILAYFGSPYLAARDLREALQGGDTDKIEADVDIAAVKDSLKSQLSAIFMRKMKSDPDTKGNPFVALGALIVPAILDKAIDTYVTPDGLAALMKGQRPGEAQAGDARQMPDYDSDEEFLGLNRFRVNNKDRKSGQKGPSLLFERRGIFAWKLIKIELPQNILDDKDTPTAASSVQNDGGATEPLAAQPQAGAAALPQPASGGDDSFPTAASLTEYKFQDFPSVPYNGPWVRPNFAGAQRDFRTYRTMISDGAKRGPVFAGSVAITQFGCGTDCSMGYAIDLKDGRVVPLPVGGEANSDLDVEYHLESRLLKAAWKGAARDYSGTPADCRGFAYFEWTGNDFRTVKASPHSSACE